MRKYVNLVLQLDHELESYHGLGIYPCAVTDNKRVMLTCRIQFPFFPANCPAAHAEVIARGTKCVLRYER